MQLARDANTNIKLSFLNDSETSAVKQSNWSLNHQKSINHKKMLISMLKKFDLFKPTLWL